MINDEQRAKLIWQCRRGMLELDLLLEPFIQHGIDKINVEDYSHLEALLKHADPDLYNWLMGYEIPSDKDVSKGIEIIKLHTAF